MRLRYGRYIAAVLFIVFMIATVGGCKKTEKEVPFTPKLDTDSKASVTVYGNYSNFEASHRIRISAVCAYCF